MERSIEATEAATGSDDDHQIDHSTGHHDSTSAAISNAAGVTACSNPTTAAASPIQQDVKGKQTAWLDCSSTTHAAAADHTISGSLHFNDQETENAASQETVTGCEQRENKSISPRRPDDGLLMPPPPPTPVVKRDNPDEGSSIGAGGGRDDQEISTQEETTSIDEQNAESPSHDPDKKRFMSGDGSGGSEDPISQENDTVPGHWHFNLNASHTHLAPGSRTLAPEDFCFRKVLDSSEVKQKMYCRLNLTPEQATTLPSFPKMTGIDCASEMEATTITVFDGQDWRWRMDFAAYREQDEITYAINDDWINFVRFHRLTAGDTICFYKRLDSRVIPDDYYYVILYTRGGDDGVTPL